MGANVSIVINKFLYLGLKEYFLENEQKPEILKEVSSKWTIYAPALAREPSLKEINCLLSMRVMIGLKN